MHLLPRRRRAARAAALRAEYSDLMRIQSMCRLPSDRRWFATEKAARLEFLSLGWPNY